MTKQAIRDKDSQRDRPVEIEKILLEEISLAGPDDLEFLKFQVPDIVARIIRCFDSPDGSSKSI